MNFNTTNNTFRQLLGNGLTYRVPPFQRDYSWGEDEWDDLWQDIVALFDEDGEPAHYMGYLVLQSSDNKRFDIIDGQQRITTISVLILAGLGYLQGLIEAEKDADQNRARKENFLKSYIGYVDPVSLLPRSKLELNRHNNRFYQTYLVPLEQMPQRNLHASEHQLRKAFNWFKERYIAKFGTTNESGKNFAKMLDALVDKLFFTVITVTDELNAFKVFETLNARGVRLSATDLLKNYLFSLVSSSELHESEMKALEERWERIIGLLGTESFPEFLRVYWNSKNRLVRKTELFKTIRKRVSRREDAFALIRDLDSSAETYAALRDPTYSGWNASERAALQKLMMFSVRQPLSMLMACHRAFYESQRSGFSRLLDAVAIVSLRYNVICGLQTHDQEHVYNKVAYQLARGDLSTVHEVLSALKELYPDDRTFKAAFSQKALKTTNARNKKVARYILFELEKQKSGQDLDFDSATYNLEHILPENPSEAWNTAVDGLHERLVYRLGNLTPINQNDNRKIGNSDFAEKKHAYAASDFEITRGIAEHYDDWNAVTIEKRQTRLAELAATVWKIQF